MIVRVQILIPLIPTIKLYFCFKIRRKPLSTPFTSEFSIEFDAPIWEIRPAGNLLLVTLKDKEQLQTTFSLFDLSTNAFLFENISFEEDWWVSLYLFDGEIAVFQHYDDTQDIEKRSVFGFDCSKQEVLWAIEDIKLQQVDSQTIYCVPMDAEEGYYFDTHKGEIIASPQKEHALSEGIYPIQYQSETEHHQLITKFVARQRQGLVGPIDYLEQDDLIIISANFEQEGTYELCLFVYDSKGHLLEEIVLGKELVGQALGTFFILKQALIFVEETQLIQVRRLK